MRCPSCWYEPCLCGEAYKKLDTDALQSLITVLQDIRLEKLIKKAMEQERD